MADELLEDEGGEPERHDVCDLCGDSLLAMRIAVWDGVDTFMVLCPTCETERCLRSLGLKD